MGQTGRSTSSRSSPRRKPRPADHRRPGQARSPFFLAQARRQLARPADRVHDRRNLLHCLELYGEAESTTATCATGSTSHEHHHHLGRARSPRGRPVAVLRARARSRLRPGGLGWPGTPRRRQRSPTAIIWLSEWQRVNLDAEHARLLDLGRYRHCGCRSRGRSCPSCPSGCAWPANAASSSSDTATSADVLGLRRYAHPSKIREKFGPALEELRAAGYIGAWSLDVHADGDDFNITLRAPVQVHAIAFTARRRATSPSSPAQPASPVIEVLVRAASPATRQRSCSRSSQPHRMSPVTSPGSTSCWSPRQDALSGIRRASSTAPFESNAPVPEEARAAAGEGAIAARPGDRGEATAAQRLRAVRPDTCPRLHRGPACG